MFPDERFEIEERIAQEAAAIIAECPQDRDDLLGLYGAPSERIRIVPCGFSAEELGPRPQHESRTRLELPLDEPVLLQLGRMVRRKGVEEVIRGFARLIHDYRQIGTLVIVGGDSQQPDPERTPELGRLMGIAREEGVAGRVRFEGQRDREQLRDYYCAADVFLSTPWYEPFGITPVEAMACGVPVLGSAVGGIKSTVVDGETGFLVPPRNPEAIAERLAVMLRDPRTLTRMRERALQRSKQFTWQKVTDGIEEVYLEALTGQQPLRSGNYEFRGSQKIPTLASGRTAGRVPAARSSPAVLTTAPTALPDKHETLNHEGGR